MKRETAVVRPCVVWKDVPSLLETKGLHVTDAEVLAIARERDGIAVIGDLLVDFMSLSGLVV